MCRISLRLFLPLLAVALTSLGQAQDEKEVWTQWYSETLGVLFLSMGKPVEEVVEYRGALAEKAAQPVAVGFNVGDTEFSVARLKLNDGETLTPKQVLDLRLAVPRAKAPDFKVKDEKEMSDSDFPCAQNWCEYTGPDEVLVSRKLLVIGNKSDIWILEAVGLTSLEGREAASKFFDSVRMDLEGKIKPGSKKST